MKILSALVAASLIAVSGLQPADAQQLVTNGGFEATTINGIATNSGGQLGFDKYAATGWSVAASPGSYMFLFTPGTADGAGETGADGTLSLWGSNNGELDALPVSPNGGNFIAMDGDYETSAITQTISGLTVGKLYNITFDYGYAQQKGFTGATTQDIKACLGSTCATTPSLTNPSKGFTGWFTTDDVFQATATSEVLSFLAQSSTPVPPFALLDGVSVTAVPELSSWVLMLSGFAGIGLAGYRRRDRKLLPAE